MLVCSNCFIDKALIRLLQSENIVGTNRICPTCGKENIKCIEANQLSDYFIEILDLYDTSELNEALLLHDRIQKDWGIFNPQIIEKSREILNAIIDIPNWNQNLTKKWILKEDTMFQEEWDRFSEEIKHKNRFFITIPFQHTPFEIIWEFLDITIPVGTKLYRSRINPPNKRYNKSKMGKPPKKITLSGRANPFGIPYLYLTSDRDTSISEVRPAKGQSVTVGYFKVLEEIKVINFRKVSPFELILHSAYESIKNISTLNNIITLINERLSLPIDPKIANLEYIPTQYICEKIKSLKYDGVAFQSAMGNGINYAFFEDDKLNCYTTRKHSIKDLSYKIN